MVRRWLLEQLELVKDLPRVLVRDPLRLLPEVDGEIDAFGQQNGFSVVIASTNLAFRNHYEHVVSDPAVTKVLVIDRAPKKRRIHAGTQQAPPPFYPDLLAVTPPEARIEIDLRRLLIQETGDPDWPAMANDPRYARMMAPCLQGVLQAHSNLQTAHTGFTDKDFEKIVAFAALGIGDAAFKTLGPEEYWRIGLIGHRSLRNLDDLVPDVTQPIRDELEKGPAPFCWFARHDSDIVIRAFYLSLVLSQHVDGWSLLLANVDPNLKPFTGISDDTLRTAAPKLVSLDPDQAGHDLADAEDGLDRDALQLVLLDQMKVSSPDGFTAALERERHSTLFASLALLMALDNLMAEEPAATDQNRVHAALAGASGDGGPRVLDLRGSAAWSNLKEAYRLARQVKKLQQELSQGVRGLKVKRPDQFTFDDFRELWNAKQTNRLEYYSSALERLVSSAELLPASEDRLPSAFLNAMNRVKDQTGRMALDVARSLSDLNACFQAFVAEHYPTWVSSDTEVRLTSQFLRRVLKPHWDPEKEDAIVLVFDGMRYDIWDELLRPMLEDRLEVIEDIPGLSLLPSETHITRKAISAGTTPDSFDTRSSEDRLLRDALVPEFGYTGEITSGGAGVGGVVSYKAGRLTYCIFDLCDGELHGRGLKTLPGGGQVPDPPLSFIYKQHIKNIIDTEVMALVRGLRPGTKVFVVADHGFGPVGRQPLWFEKGQLYSDSDCKYSNCRLPEELKLADLAGKVRDNTIAFESETLRLPQVVTTTDPDSKQMVARSYGYILFPKVGYSFKRAKGPYNPDAYSHGGISIQELMVPMVVLRVRRQDEGLLTLGEIGGPDNIVEGETAEFTLEVARTGRGTGEKDDLRIDVDAAYCHTQQGQDPPPQVCYVPAHGCQVVIRLKPDAADASDDERGAQVMQRTLTITVSYYDGRRTQLLTQTKSFTMKLNSEQVIRRVPPKLGNILGLKPKTV